MQHLMRSKNVVKCEGNVQKLVKTIDYRPRNVCASVVSAVHLAQVNSRTAYKARQLTIVAPVNVRSAS